MGFLVFFIILPALFFLFCLAPAFFLTFTASSMKWCLAALVSVGSVLLYMGSSKMKDPCNASLGMIPLPEPSDYWLVVFLALLFGAVLRGFIAVTGGFNSVTSRLVLSVPLLFIFSIFSFPILSRLESLLGLASCSF